MRKNLLPMTFLAIFLGAAGLPSEEFDEYSITKENSKVLDRFIQGAAQNDKRLLASSIEYPLRRKYPIPPVSNAREMVQRFNHVFTRELLTEIAQSSVARNWSDVGWRGIMLNQGHIWANYDGYVFAINPQSKFEVELQEHLVQLEKRYLHSSLGQKFWPILIAADHRRVIRIDNTKTGYRYTVWPAGSKQSEEPELIIEGGTLDVMGTMHHHTYAFESGSYAYVFETTPRVPEAKLLVLKDEEVIFTTTMRFVQPFRFVSGKFKHRFGNYQYRFL